MKVKTCCLRLIRHAAAVAIASVPLMACTLVDTTPYWSGSDYVFPFGAAGGAFATFGQTITAPSTDNVLQSFRFYVSLDPSVVFRGYVFAWDDVNRMATGSVLWSSDDMKTSQAAAFDEVVFNTGGLPLIPDGRYVLFASLSRISGDSWGFWGTPQSDVYNGGRFVYLYSGSDSALWTSSAWGYLLTNWGPRGGLSPRVDGAAPGDLDLDIDLAFKASFSSPGDPWHGVPEPGVLILLGSGLTGLALYARRSCLGRPGRRPYFALSRFAKRRYAPGTPAGN